VAFATLVVCALFAGVMAAPNIYNPDSSSTWVAGDYRYIQWTFSSSDRVSIYWRTSSSSYWNLIVSGTTNSGSYGWSVPYGVDDTCQIKVASYVDSLNYGTSYYFSIYSSTHNGTFPAYGIVLIVFFFVAIVICSWWARARRRCYRTSIITATTYQPAPSYIVQQPPVVYQPVSGPAPFSNSQSVPYTPLYTPQPQASYPPQYAPQQGYQTEGQPPQQGYYQPPPSNAPY